MQRRGRWLVVGFRSGQPIRTDTLEAGTGPHLVADGEAILTATLAITTLAPIAGQSTGVQSSDVQSSGGR
jgi:hypothetical protein